MNDNFGEGPSNEFGKILNPDNDYNGKSCTGTNDEVSKRKLFVGNLARRTNSKELTALFSAYGKVEHCHLYVSGRNNCALVTFTNAEDVLKALKDGLIKKFHLHHRDLDVMPANSLHESDNVQTQTKKAKFTESLTQYDLNEDSKIHRLNDDCLIQIFSFLPIADRVRFERVCKRWRLISHASWRSFRQLDLSESCWGYTLHTFAESCGKLNIKTLQKVLSRTGKFLTHVDLSTSAAENLSKGTLSLIGRLCPNLLEIDVTAVNATPAGIKALAKNCTKIIKCSLGRCASATCDTHLSTLFTRNKNLRYLKLICISLIGECLSNIHSDSIQEIYLEDCYKIVPRYLSKAIEMFPNLHTLCLKRVGLSVNDQTITVISSRNDSLRKLHFCESYTIINENTMMLITALTNLETLNISQNSCVNDAFLLAVGTKCKQLKNVDISFCDQVSNEGLCIITSLPKLECLKMSYLSNVTDSALTDMPNLKILECRGSRRIGNTGLISLIEESHCLELIDLSGCNNVDNEFIEAAVKATINRTNGIVCKIYVGGSGVYVTSIVKESPLLKVIEQDLSDRYLIPDLESSFSDEMSEMGGFDDDDDDDEDDNYNDWFDDEQYSDFGFFHHGYKYHHMYNLNGDTDSDADSNTDSE